MKSVTFHRADCCRALVTAVADGRLRADRLNGSTATGLIIHHLSFNDFRIMLRSNRTHSVSKSEIGKKQSIQTDKQTDRLIH